MKKLTAFISAVALTSAFGASAFANSPDVYVVKFRHDGNIKSQQLESELNVAMAMVDGVEEVIIDTSNPAKWEKSAHEAFDRDIVPVFNKWVGLPGFAAVVDANTKQVMGCVNASFSSTEMAEEIRIMQSRASGQAYMSRASIGGKTTQCPAAHNVDPGR